MVGAAAADNGVRLGTTADVLRQLDNALLTHRLASSGRDEHGGLASVAGEDAVLVDHNN